MISIRKTLIVAIGKNGEIGKNNDLLWHLPADMRFFKETTQGGTVIMGRKNWDSIPEKFRPLANRENIILTRNNNFSAQGAQVFTNWDDCIAHCKSISDKEIFIIGGAQVYDLALSAGDVDRMLITHVDAAFDADTFFPKWNKQEWEETVIQNYPADEKNPFSFTIKEYRKK
jgi:dihydrofolate reductase